MAIPAILDGRYFDIIAADGNKVRARCLMCTTKPRIIEGFKTPTSNFKTHLKRLHPEKLLEYEAYKFNKRRKVDFTSCIPSYSYSSDFNLNIKHEPTYGTGTGTPVTFTDYMPKLLPTSGTGTGTPFTDYMPKLLQKDKRVGKLQYQDDTLLMDFIIESMSPVEIVEGENFKRLIKGFHSDSTVMSAKTLKTSLLNKAAEQTKTISEQLAAASTICMTVDICSIGNISYLGSTVHILDEFTFARKSFTLACRRFGGPLTYDEVSDVYQELVDRFEIDTNKIHYIITNNGNNPFKPFEKYKSIPNMNGDTEMILPESPESELEDDDRDHDFWLTDSDILFGSSESSGKSLPQHFKSASHNLNLVATIDSDNIPPGEHCQGYTELLQSSMGKCAAIYNKSHRSPDYGEMIKHIFISGNMKEWTCQYDVLVQLLKIKGNLEEVCLLFQLPEFTNEEVEFLKEYLKAVGPIATALEMLHIDNKFMFGCLAPTILSVQTKLKDFLVKDQLRLVTPLVHALLNGLSQRFPYVLELDSQNEKLRKLIIASISMPYFKLRWIPQEKLEEFKQVFVDEAVKMVGLTNSVPVPVTPKLEEQEFFEFPSQSPSADSVENSANAKIKLECRQYFESGGIELEILHYFPNIKKLFLIHNTPISSSSPVEKMLNFSGLIKSPGRGDMVENDLFEILCFLKCNGN